MNIQSKQVEGTIKDYFKKGALNVWQHQVVYLIPLLFLLPTVGLLGIMPNYAKNFFLFFVGIAYIFWFMEITFTTTQEKYTPKKYFASIVVAAYAMMGFVKRHIVTITILVGTSLAIDIFVLMSKVSAVESVTVVDITKQFLMGILRHSSTNALIDAAVIGYIAREVISDYFVTQRMTGMQSETPESLMDTAVSQNGDLLKKFAYTGVTFTILSPIMFGLQSILFIIMVAALTLYSMEVFGVDTGKKQRQEETEKAKEEVENLIPAPLN